MRVIALKSAVSVKKKKKALALFKNAWGGFAEYLRVIIVHDILLYRQHKKRDCGGKGEKRAAKQLGPCRVERDLFLTSPC